MKDLSKVTGRPTALIVSLKAWEDIGMCMPSTAMVLSLMTSKFFRETSLRMGWISIAFLAVELKTSCDNVVYFIR